MSFIVCNDQKNKISVVYVKSVMHNLFVDNIVLYGAVSLVGQSAPPEVLQKLTYLVIMHSQIKRIDTVRAYTFGVLYFVEVDIELAENLPLREAHNIGESIQIMLEKLPEVERAFVHLDFECDHKPEHSVLTKLPDSQP